MYLKELEQQEQSKPKISIKIRVVINEIELIKTI